MSAVILVADDDATIRTVVREALSRAGHQVRTADSIAALWKLIDDGVGDAVVTDVILPDGNGLDLIPRIVERRPGLPVIVMSAQNTLSTAVRATEQGAFEYLPKPFDIDALTRIVASALARAGHLVHQAERLAADRAFAGNAGSVSDHRARRADRPQRADPGGVWHRQGTRSAGAA